MSTNVLLPGADRSGDVHRWYLPLDVHPGDEEQHLVFYGRFLGLGTSFTPTHVRGTVTSPDPHTEGGGRFVPRRTRCNACRWYEARIFRELLLPAGVDDLSELDDPRDARPGDYVIHSAGMSVVDGEGPLYRYETTQSAFTVVELMTTRRTTDGGPEAFLAKPAARALSEAAGHDAGIREAYINRAVS